MGSLQRRLDELARSAPRAPGRPPRQPSSTPRTLADLLGGSEAHCRGVPYWTIAMPFREACGTSLPDTHPLSTPLDCEVSRTEAVQLDPQRTLILDIETGGFSGTPVFLIGVVALDRWPLIVEQWLARDYPEEQAILGQLALWARPRDTWVTFNGKTFDAPFVRDRAALYGIHLPPPRVHVDLLHLARRRWRGELPDCRLETLEREVLARTRLGDVPSSDVPDLFHHFIRTRNAAPLKPVLEHNRLDLISSTELLMRFARRARHD
jgi:uncharacterized protein YprB with RNaseH-like and TPR domain